MNIFNRTKPIAPTSLMGNSMNMFNRTKPIAPTSLMGNASSLFMFHTCVLSRLAYLDEAMFLIQWNRIYSHECIDPTFLNAYNGNLLLSEDRHVFKTSPIDGTTDHMNVITPLPGLDIEMTSLSAGPTGSVSMGPTGSVSMGPTGSVSMGPTGFMGPTGSVSMGPTGFMGPTGLVSSILDDTDSDPPGPPIRSAPPVQHSTTSINYMKWAEKVNILLTEAPFAYGNSTEQSKNCRLPDITDDSFSKDVIMVSIATSNYKSIYVVCDRRIPQLIYVIFKGTSSYKEASSYNRPSSIVPTTVKGDTYLYGVFKILMDCIHEIISAVKWVRAQLPHTPWRLVTTGHSLGGALATIFAYIYTKSNIFTEQLTQQQIKEKDTYPKTFTNPSDPITCVVFGTPRVFGKETAIQFCNFCNTLNQRIDYRRIVTANDAVPGLPGNVFGFRHPCSNSSQTEIQNTVYVHCDQQVKRKTSQRCGRLLNLEIDYTLPLDCRSGKTKRAFRQVGFTDFSAIDHTQYLGIGFSNAVNVEEFIKSPIDKFNDKKTSSSVMRIGFYKSYEPTRLRFRFIFVHMDKQRDNPKNMLGFKNLTSEDVRDTYYFMCELEKMAKYNTDFTTPVRPQDNKYYFNETRGEELRFIKGGTKKNKKIKRQTRKR